MIHMIHTHKIVGHMFGRNVENHAEAGHIVGQIPGQMWEYTNTFVTYDTYGT